MKVRCGKQSASNFTETSLKLMFVINKYSNVSIHFEGYSLLMKTPKC